MHNWGACESPVPIARSTAVLPALVFLITCNLSFTQATPQYITLK